MFITDARARRHPAQSFQTENLERDLTRAIARRDRDAVREIGKRMGNNRDMLALLWRVVDDNDFRAIGFVSSAWDGLNGWWK
jgi:hypothetical protein